MGIWRRVGSFLGVPAHQFAADESAPQPIDQMLRSMLASAAVGGRVSRNEALAVPAVQQGRRMVGAVATLPLAAYRLADWVEIDNPLLRQIDPDVPNVITLGQTIDDLLFDAVSWWRVTARDFDGFPISARHLDLTSVVVRQRNDRQSPAPLPSGIDPRGATVYVDGVLTSWADLIRFDSPSPPLLTVGARAVRRALAIDNAAEMYANDPRPLDYFTPVEGADPVDDDEIVDFLGVWRGARRERSTAYVPTALKYNEVTAPSPQELQLVELQRQATLDIANAMGADPEDLGVSTTSRTYANAVDRRQDKVNTTLAPFIRAITDRLSMGDVTRRGYVVRFDLDDFLKANPTDRWAVYSQAKAMGAMGVSEIRTKEKLGPLPDDAEATPPPAPPAPAEDDEQADADLAAGPVLTFGGAELLTFAADTIEFSVDRETRTIRGTALPYGKLSSTKGGLKYEFERGSLRWATDVSRTKLTEDHEMTKAIGYALELGEARGGLASVFKVARGAEGDRALTLAEDKVKDGLSVGLDPESVRAVPHPRVKNALLVKSAFVREIALTAAPSFDDARVSAVAFNQEDQMPDEPEQTAPAAPAAPAAPEQPNDQAAQFAAFTAWQAEQANGGPTRPPGPETERPRVVNPTRPVAFVSEPQPYRFDRAGNFVPGQEFTFSADLHAMAAENDPFGTKTEAGKRVMALLAATFDVDSADINEVTPAINRPDMYVDQRDYRTPLWNFVNKGAPPNGITPFIFPKFSSASGLVGDHTEGTEPTGGTLVTTNQTVTPSALSGKAYITREVWDMGGNPAVSTLIWNQMVRGYREGLESATATFLNTLTAATDITLPAGSADETLAAAWEAAVADLQFIRGYDFEAFALEKELYKKFAAARDTSERPLYPILSPMNANGTAASRFRTLNLAGVTGVPSWALASTAGSPNNSWLFDPTTVHGWATAPQRLEFPGGSDDNTTYQPVAKVGLGIWGYKAFANSDIAGVRQVIYDTTA
ncbi:phage portal protein [Asanoa siamensis]|uniref:phage portal protein n=1 Tax=Asanoa siamensis TaxID=926357 RepID=UPI001942EECF|nr:phage portal protein [Asanoa siamensis]